MANKIITIGASTQNNKVVNGQTMMFQLLYDYLKQQKEMKPVLVDFGLSVHKNFSDIRVSGKFSYIKLIDNVIAMVKLLFALIMNPKAPVYINTSQSKVGFLRDYIFINLSKFFKRKVIAHQFGANYENFYKAQSDNMKRRIKKTIEKTDVFIVEGDYTKQQLKFVKDFEKKVKAIPNGLPQKIVHEVKSKQLKKPVMLFYLSNMIEGKGFWDVLEAGNLLKNQYKIPIKLVFSGKFLEDVEDTICQSSQEAKDRFTRKLKEFGLENDIEYFEGLYDMKKAEYFQKAHFFILPSYYINEGQPVAVLEALAYGCVPIVTPYRLIPMMVNPNHGYFVEPKSPHQIANVVLYCLDNDKEYSQKSKNAIAYYNEHFTPQKYINEILKLLINENKK